MSTTGMNLAPSSVAARRFRAVWLAKRGWKAAEVARELRVSQRTVERYKARVRAEVAR